MKKNLLYVGILIVLAGLTYFFVFRENDNNFDKSETNFTVKDINSIQTIFLASMQGDHVKISRKGEGWVLNDSMTVRQDAVDFLLDALEHQKADQPVPTGYHDAAIRELSTNATKVEIYNEDGKTHTFYVGRNPGYNNVTYMLNEGAKRPYIVKMPVQKIFLGVRYFTRTNEWRDHKILFDNAPIESVHVVFKDSTQYSYTVKGSGDQVEVTGNSLSANPLNKKRVNTYLGLLDKIYCTGFEDQYLFKDTILHQGRQMATITVNRKGISPQTLTVYFKPTDKGTKSAFKLGNEEYDIDSFLGLLNNKDFIMMSRKTVEKMIRSYPEFFEADAVPVSQ